MLPERPGTVGRVPHIGGRCDRGVTGREGRPEPRPYLLIRKLSVVGFKMVP
jgi:hypothetical protein